MIAWQTRIANCTWVALIGLGSLPQVAQAQTATSPTPQDPVARYATAPTRDLLPRLSYLAVPTKNFAGEIPSGEGLLDPNLFRIQKVLPTGELDPEQLSIEAVELDRKDGNELVNIFFRPGGVRQGQKVAVAIRRQDGSGFVWYREKKKSEEFTPIKISVSPSFEPKIGTPDYKSSQELIGGHETAVGHFKLDLKSDALFRRTARNRIFLLNENVISTNRRDLSAGMKLKIGTVRGLPEEIEQKIQLTGEVITNQLFTDSTYVIALEDTLTRPGEWTVKLLQNPVFSIPYRPTVRVAVEYRKRFQVDERILKDGDKREVLGLNGRVKIDRVKLFSKSGLELDAMLEGWFFPRLTTFEGANTTNTKGNAEIAMTLPIHFRLKQSARRISTPGLQELVARGLKPIDTTIKVRVGYRVGAEETNGFRPTSSPIIDIKADF